jgi:hypothetical protein
VDCEGEPVISNEVTYSERFLDPRRFSVASFEVFAYGATQFE